MGSSVPALLSRSQPVAGAQSTSLMRERWSTLARPICDSLASSLRTYLHDVVRIPNPRIALLSNGHEPGKGNQLVREATSCWLHAEGLNFAGNIEANAIPDGEVDGVVCDGFSGNVLLKGAEGTASLVQDALRSELTAR